MENFNPILLLLLCVAALCITTTAGYYNHGHPLLIPSHGQPNSIHKRQIEVNQLRVCQKIISEEQCTNGLSQETANLAVQCNSFFVAAIIRESCRQNSAGDYCALAATYAVNDIQTITAECSPDTNSVCTARCKNLLTLIRSQLGCCLNIAFNNSASPLFTPGPFLNSVWTRCGVEPITEECTQSPIQLPQAPIDPTCSTPGIFAARAGEFQCSTRLLQPIINKLMESETCQIYAQGAPEVCGVDESGTHCYEQVDALTSAFLESQTACGNETTCTPLCEAALRNFTSIGGCCINNFFNGTLAGITSVRYEWMSSRFWEGCGIETPGLCEVRLNGGVIPQETATIVAFTSATARTAAGYAIVISIAFLILSIVY